MSARNEHCLVNVQLVRRNVAHLLSPLWLKVLITEIKLCAVWLEENQHCYLLMYEIKGALGMVQEGK